MQRRRGYHSSNWSGVGAPKSRKMRKSTATKRPGKCSANVGRVALLRTLLSTQTPWGTGSAGLARRPSSSAASRGPRARKHVGSRAIAQIGLLHSHSSSSEMQHRNRSNQHQAATNRRGFQRPGKRRTRLPEPTGQWGQHGSSIYRIDLFAREITPPRPRNRRGLPGPGSVTQSMSQAGWPKTGEFLWRSARAAER